VRVYQRPPRNQLNSTSYETVAYYAMRYNVESEHTMCPTTILVLQIIIGFTVEWFGDLMIVTLDKCYTFPFSLISSEGNLEIVYKQRNSSV
jgi:hypothetical protein